MFLIRLLGIALYFTLGYGLMWLGFEQQGVEMPGPFEAPWLYGIVGVVMLVPARHWWWDFSDLTRTGYDGYDAGDLGE